MIHIYYFTLLALTAIGSSVMTAYAPTILSRLKRLFTRKKRYQPFTNTKPCGLIQLEVEDLQKKVNDLETQVHNLAEKQATQDRNRKSNIRRDVREYLKELQND